MLLIFPPAAKPCEPPAGIAKLAGALNTHGVSCRIVDMNLEWILYLANQPVSAADTWTRRAVKNISRNIDALRDDRTYGSLARYSRAVMDVNRVLEAAGKSGRVIMGLADYHDEKLSPVRSADLIEAAELPERNIFYKYFQKRLSEIMEGRHKPEYIGFSLNYLSQALCTFAMIGWIRKKFPGIRMVLGGGLVSSWMKRPGWQNPFSGLVDHLIAGPGEAPLLSLLGIKGTQNHCAPDYASFMLRDYLSPGFILPYSGSSGCYWNKCTFCPEKAEGNDYLPLPVDQAMADLDFLRTKTKPVLLHFLDNAISPGLLRALACKPSGVPWYGFARISKNLANFEYCKSLKEAGCKMLKLGLESGDQAVLDAMEKGIDVETASLVLKNLKRAGIGTYLYLLFGTPAETIMEARRTLDFVVQHRDEITFLNIAIFNMPVCSREAAEYETEKFYEGDLSLYTGFKHPRGWDRKKVRLFLEHEFKRNPAVSAILKNDPPLFTSNHAAFFVS